MQPQIADLLVDTATLLVVGMLTVFVFLTLLIGAIHLIARLNTWLPESAAASVPGAAKSLPSRTATSNSGLSAAKLAAMSAAVHKYRSTK